MSSRQDEKIGNLELALQVHMTGPDYMKRTDHGADVYFRRGHEKPALIVDKGKRLTIAISNLELEAEILGLMIKSGIDPDKQEFLETDDYFIYTL